MALSNIAVVATVAAVCLLGLVVSTHAAKKPNFILLFVDDLGYNDVGFHNDEVKTPYLDKLASKSVRLEQYYSNQVCSPSRYSLLTGRYPYKNFVSKEAVALEPFCPPLDQKMLGERLRDEGYKTHLVGKWHLGYCSWRCTPTYRGFDTHYGFLSGGVERYSKGAFHMEHLYDWWDNKGEDIFSDRSTEGKYADKLLTKRAVKLIKEHDSKNPMFMFVSYGNMHKPYQAPQKYVDMYPEVEDEQRKQYLGMISYVDKSVKKIVKALKDNDMYDDSVIVFFADNGGAYPEHNTPLRGLKGQLWEGGIRVPAFVHSPFLGKPAALKNDSSGLMHISDFFPTFLDLAGAEPEPGVDGVSQRELLSGGNTARTEVVHGAVANSVGGRPSHPQLAVRKGDFKFVLEGDWGDETTGWNPKLFDVINDPSETNDLSQTNKEKYNELVAVANAAWSEYVAGPAVDENFAPSEDLWSDTFQPGYCKVEGDPGYMGCPTDSPSLHARLHTEL